MPDLMVIDAETGELVDEDSPIELGRQAWARIKDRDKALLKDWLITAAALDVGREACTAPHGGLNKKAFGEWCLREAFDDIPAPTRSDALWLYDNQDSILGNTQITFNDPTNARKQWRKLEKKAKKALALEEIKAAADSPIHSDSFDIRHCSMQELFASGVKPDVIISDPPYPKEYIHLYGELSEHAAAAGVRMLAVMAGQSYLPDIYEQMSRHMKYRWTMAYMTPGGQSTQLWDRKVNTFWKPIILFGESDDWLGDVAKSAINDNDKRFHEWGQSESGMVDLIRRLSKPGELVCDPFIGAGTTAVAAISQGRRFVGCDVDENHVRSSIGRCLLALGAENDSQE